MPPADRVILAYRLSRGLLTPLPPLIQHMRINHRRRHILIAEQFLHREEKMGAGLNGTYLTPKLQ